MVCYHANTTSLGVLLILRCPEAKHIIFSSENSSTFQTFLEYLPLCSVSD